jgi:Protein of unknown function (DUF2848)
MTSTASPLQLRLLTRTTSRRRHITLAHLAIASWTGRDLLSMELRLAELEALGIPRPPGLPVLYRIAAHRGVTASRIEVVGEHTTGEAEFVLLRLDGHVWVGVGSDHTDRLTEVQSAAMAKQACEKPICAGFWLLDDVVDHWDTLRLRSFVENEDGERHAYQDGGVNSMLAPHELLGCWAACDKAPEPALLFCGTLPTIGPLRGASRFALELEDPVLDRRLSHAYDVIVLPPHMTPRDSARQAEGNAPSRS